MNAAAITTYSYDNNGQVTDILNQNGALTSTIADFGYQYNPAGQVTAQIDNGTATTTFAYDAAGQLTSYGSSNVTYDNTGNRIRKIRELLFESLGVADHDDMFLAYSFVWRGSRRRCDLLYANVRELPDESLRAQGDDWKVIVDWPFDDPGHDPQEDHAKLDGFLARNDSTRTLAWLPAFFSTRTQGELGKLVILDHLLRGDNLDQHAQHLSQQDRLSARLVLENQQSALEATLKQALNAAFGIAREPQPGTLDATHEPAFRTLDRSFTPQVPVGADLGSALEHLLGQAMRRRPGSEVVVEQIVQAICRREVSHGGLLSC